ncbi:hypothetical protein cyc_00222 [Cyclospora cayetanensis]|uniref:HhH-GPD domain-containing protein n=1 Tax=Cyclospora cayetanensis TaxID=88456 RepID=A0A1D3CU88_9EIME|nr:hypothetical protein cyc_00222 [Cyclospora cayetanensis]
MQISGRLLLSPRPCLSNHASLPLLQEALKEANQRRLGRRLQRICLEGELPSGEAEESDILGQIKRMCRLDATAFRGCSIEAFWAMHPAAKERKFGHLFRSPTIWEDMVKTITICNVRWKQSLKMNRLLCTLASSVKGSFPSPWDIIGFSSEELQRLCSLGYRGERVRRLAACIIDGSLDLSFFESLENSIPRTPGENLSLIALCDPRPLKPGILEEQQPKKKRALQQEKQTDDGEPDKRVLSLSTFAHRDEILKKLLSIFGFGKFAAENMMQLLGFFDVYAFDSETARHMKEIHGFTHKETNRVWAEAKRRLDPFHPFQFVAYWFELWKMYEKETGIPSPWWNAENSFFLGPEGAFIAACLRVHCLLT